MQILPMQCTCFAFLATDDTSNFPVRRSIEVSNTSPISWLSMSGAGMITPASPILRESGFEVTTEAAAFAASKKPDPGMIGLPDTCVMQLKFMVFAVMVILRCTSRRSCTCCTTCWFDYLCQPIISFKWCSSQIPDIS